LRIIEKHRATTNQKIPKSGVQPGDQSPDLFPKEAIRVHPQLEIKKITPDLVYRGVKPHPLAGQDVFEGHAQHGVFAKGKILGKTSLGEYVGEVYLSKSGMEKSEQRGFYCWHLLLKDTPIYIYSGKWANELTFVNDFHGLGKEPNVVGKWMTYLGFYYFGYETTRDIASGEEILIDYKFNRLKKDL
jgi:hypothetical protein